MIFLFLKEEVVDDEIQAINTELAENEDTDLETSEADTDSLAEMEWGDVRDKGHPPPLKAAKKRLNIAAKTPIIPKITVEPPQLIRTSRKCEIAEPGLLLRANPQRATKRKATESLFIDTSDEVGEIEIENNTSPNLQEGVGSDGKSITFINIRSKRTKDTLETGTELQVFIFV